MTDCQLYLISPLEVGGAFPDRLARALDAGAVAAFQFRVKGVDEHEAARLAAPLQEICAQREVALSSTIRSAWPNGSRLTGFIWGRMTARLKKPASVWAGKSS